MILRLVVAALLLALPARAAPDAFDATGYLMTMSNSDRTATSTSGANATAVSVNPQFSGKHYFEVVFNVSNANTGFGVASYPAGTAVACGFYLGNSTTSIGFFPAYNSGAIYYNGTEAKNNIGANSSTDTYRFAIDMDNKTFWAAKTTGNWNNDGAADPATNTGGVSFSSIGNSIWLTFCSKTNGESAAVNFGQSAFSYSVPSGFNSGWNTQATQPNSASLRPSYGQQQTFTNFEGFYSVQKLTLSANAKLDTLRVFLSPHTVTGFEMRGVVLSDSSGAPATGAPLCTGDKITSSVTGYNDATFTVACNLTAGDYWFGYAATTTSGAIAPGKTSQSPNANKYVSIGSVDSLPGSPSWSDQTGATTMQLFTSAYTGGGGARSRGLIIQ